MRRILDIPSSCAAPRFRTSNLKYQVWIQDQRGLHLRFGSHSVKRGRYRNLLRFRRSSSNRVGTAGPQQFSYLRGPEAVLSQHYRHFLRLLLSSVDPSTLITNRGSLFISISLSRNISCNHVISVCHPCVSKHLILQEGVMKTFTALRQKGKVESLQPSPPVSPGGDLSEMSSPWRKRQDAVNKLLHNILRRLTCLSGVLISPLLF